MGRAVGTPARNLVAVTLGVTVAFVAGTLYSQGQALRIDAHARALALGAAPNLQALTTTRGFLRDMQVSTEDAIVRAAQGASTRQSHDSFERAKQDFEKGLAELHSLPMDPRERSVFDQVFAAAPGVERALAEALSFAENDDLTNARAVWLWKIVNQAKSVDANLERLVSLNAMMTREQALRIEGGRRHATHVALAIMALTAVLAIAAMLAARRAVRYYGRLERERAEELDQFASRMAHDVISPLGAIRIALQLCEKNADEKTRRIVARGLSAVERQTQIVQGLLDFARAGGHPNGDGSCNMSSIAESVVDEMRPGAEAAGVEIKTEITPWACVRCSDGVTTSLISNLLRNAIKYMNAGPVRRVVVRVYAVRGFVRVEVGDTGPGIPPELQSRVFDPYVRGSDTSKPGIGLGLATVKRAVEAHGGRVGLKSTPGDGSCFWFELPAAPGEQPATSLAPHEPCAPA